MNVTKAMREIESIIFMDEDQKSKKRDMQLQSAQSTYSNNNNNNGGGNSLR